MAIRHHGKYVLNVEKKSVTIKVPKFQCLVTGYGVDEVSLIKLFYFKQDDPRQCHGRTQWSSRPWQRSNGIKIFSSFQFASRDICSCNCNVRYLICMRQVITLSVNLITSKSLSREDENDAQQGIKY